MININNVSKHYRCNTAINNISTSIDEGKIYCLLGCNGAGKTTLMNLIAGRINCDSGIIDIDGTKVCTSSMPSSISFIDSLSVQFNTQTKKLIDMAGALNSKFDKAFALEMARKFRLNLDKKYGQLSFGMKTMFNTLINLASGKKIVLLDEPLLGLDAVVRNKFYSILNESMLHSQRTIIISTHLIDEMIKYAEELIIMDKGSIIFRCTTNDIDEKALSITGITSHIESLDNSINIFAKKQVGKYTTAYLYDDINNIPKGFSAQHIGLQEFFINMVGGDYDEE